MKHFYFIENETGEEFIVGASNLLEAQITAEDVADSIAANYGVRADLSYEYEMTDEEAEDSGLDEY